MLADCHPASEELPTTIGFRVADVVPELSGLLMLAGLALMGDVLLAADLAIMTNLPLGDCPTLSLR